MDKITKNEALKLASFTKLTIDDNEIDAVVERLQNFLEYAIRVQDMAKDIDIPTSKNVNRQREDIVVLFDSQKILNQAPESQDNYFVVPKIIEK